MSELSDSAVEIWTVQEYDKNSCSPEDSPTLSIQGPTSGEVIEQHEPDDMQKYDQLDIDDIESAEPDVDSEDYFLQYYADFLNRLSKVHS